MDNLNPFFLNFYISDNVRLRFKLHSNKQCKTEQSHTAVSQRTN